MAMAMAMAMAMTGCCSSSPSLSRQQKKLELNNNRPYHHHQSRRCIIESKATENGGVGQRRRIWRRRKLSKKDEMIRYAQERTPFVEEQVRDIWETGKLVGYDIERLKLWEDNVFVFVNNLAEEANELVEQNKDEYGGKKKAILHAISNRMNEMGFYRPEAYMRSDPFKHITKMDIVDDEE
uniref:protein PLASTID TRANSCRIPTIONALLY ACTIVE 7 isoform X1 n=1 Tax=Erigeron canadensis TaxID=72917 RepID=UPI001CB9A24F|nr:protein PLASTID TRANSCRIPTIONALLY ACTIVE 7 isoform X1 [Erigeron canadensis]